jgi:hypothetical protein
VKDGIYALVNMEEIIGEEDWAVWFRIGREEELNSLGHLRPYFF